MSVIVATTYLWVKVAVELLGERQAQPFSLKSGAKRDGEVVHGPEHYPIKSPHSRIATLLTIPIIKAVFLFQFSECTV